MVIAQRTSLGMPIMGINVVTFPEAIAGVVPARRGSGKGGAPPVAGSIITALPLPTIEGDAVQADGRIRARDAGQAVRADGE